MERRFEFLERKFAATRATVLQYADMQCTPNFRCLDFHASLSTKHFMLLHKQSRSDLSLKIKRSVLLAVCTDFHNYVFTLKRFHVGR